MLVQLSIRDLAVVEALDLELASGLTVLTGETGAGKSILLTALGLALGDRADAAFIRSGAARAEINLGFSLSDCGAARQWLLDNELEQDGECLIRRVVSQDGRSRAFINGRPATLPSLQELGECLVEIHGQHAHVNLLKAAEQRRLLDDAAGVEDLLAEVGTLAVRCRRLRKELDAASGQVADGAAREELLRFQVEELEQHEVDGLDFAALEEEHALCANVGRILATGQAQLDRLYDDDNASVNSQIAGAIRALEELLDAAPALSGPVAVLKDAQIQVKEAASELRRTLDPLEDDPRRLEDLERRLADLHRLARKHQVRPEELPRQLSVLRGELANTARGGERLAEMRAELDQDLSAYASRAGELSRRRHAAALALQDRVTGFIRELGMPHGEFVVAVQSLTTEEPGPHGIDAIEFQVSANRGLPARPLARVASGGELSRISLAIQVAAMDSKTTGTVIFDEVDTGIGGGTAAIVGQKLRALADSGRQVLAVTHLPQVAVSGHQHLLVQKQTAGEVTQSSVASLSGDPRVEEIARMLGGLKITEQTLAHARELLDLAQAG